MLATENLNSIFFHGLINKLKAFGYNVSVEHVLEIHSLFLSLPLGENKVADLKYLLTPLIAKTKEDQQRVYKIIDDYVVEKSQEIPVGEPLAKSVVTKHNTANPPIVQKPSYYANGRVFVWAAVIILIAAIFTYWHTKTERRESIPAPAAVADSIEKILPGFTVPADTEPSPKKATAKINKGITDTNKGFAIQNLHTIQPKEKNINIQLSIILGLIAGVILSFIVFTTNEKVYFTEAESYSKAILKSPGKDGATQNLLPNKEAEGLDISLPAVVKFVGNNNIIREDNNLASIKRHMKKNKIGNVPFLDINKSILGTAERGGFYSLGYIFKKEKRQYLVLIDSLTITGHIGKLVEFFIQSLISEGIYIEKYYYKASIVTLAGSRGDVVSLKELAATKQGFHLLVFGDAKRFMDALTLLPAGQQASLFQSWQSPAVITTSPIPDWTDAEGQLAANKFAVIPAETGAIDLLIKSVTGKRELDMALVLNQVDDVYSVGQSNFTTAEHVYAYVEDRHLFQFVCSLAVYPRLDWALTLALFKALIKNNFDADVAPVSDYNLLLKVCRMPFLNAAAMSDTLRLSLLYSLDANTENIARKTIHASLQQASLSVPAGSTANEELKAQMLLNEFFLYAHDPKKNKQYAPSKKKMLQYWRKMDDWAMKNYIDSGKGKLMPKNKEGQHLTTAEFLVREGQKEVRKITVLRVLVTFLPALLIYVFLITFKPPYAYPGNREVYGLTPITVTFKKDVCPDTISQVKLHGNNIADTLYANIAHSESKDIFLDNMAYGEPVTVEYAYKGLTKKATIECKDSSYIITIKNCLLK